MVPIARRTKQNRVVQISKRDELGVNLAFRYGVTRARDIEVTRETPIRMSSSWAIA